MKTKLAVGTFAVLCLLVLNGRSQEFDLNTDLITQAVPERIPLINEYVLLATKLANRMTEEELHAGIDEMKRQLALREADDELNAVRESLQRIIDSHPGTEAAERARRALQDLRPAPESPDPDFGDDFQPRPRPDRR
jgi:hypothetical protein